MRPVPTTRTLVALTVLCATFSAASCAPRWGPVEYVVGPFSYGTDATGHLTAIAANYVASEHRETTIFGPSLRYEAVGALVWLCDANASQLRSLGLAPVQEIPPSDTVVVADWQTDNFVVNNDGSYTPWVRVWVSGAQSSATAPSDTLPASQVIAPYCRSEMDSLRAVPVEKLTWSAR